MLKRKIEKKIKQKGKSSCRFFHQEKKKKRSRNRFSSRNEGLIADRALTDKEKAWENGI